MQAAMSGTDPLIRLGADTTDLGPAQAALITVWLSPELLHLLFPAQMLASPSQPLS